MSESLFPTRWANDKPPSLEKFTSDFADDYACAEYLAKKRWKAASDARVAEGTAPGGWRLAHGYGNARAFSSMTTGREPPRAAATRHRSSPER
jgi:hypothetical protein